MTGFLATGLKLCLAITDKEKRGWFKMCSNHILHQSEIIHLKASTTRTYLKAGNFIKLRLLISVKHVISNVSILFYRFSLLSIVLSLATDVCIIS